METVPADEVSAIRAQPFPIAIDAAVIGDLRERIRNARLPEAAPGEPWAQGTDRDWLEQLLAYWADGFDWRAAQRGLNSFPHYPAPIRQAAGPFLHQRGPPRGGGSPLLPHRAPRVPLPPL